MSSRLNNQLPKDRLEIVKLQISKFVPAIIRDCVESPVIKSEDEIYFAQQITTIFQYNFWYASDIILFYEWMGLPTNRIYTNYSYNIGGDGHNVLITFNNFISRYKSTNDAREIVMKLINDLRRVKIQNDNIIDAEFSVVEKGYGYV